MTVQEFTNQIRKKRLFNKSRDMKELKTKIKRLRKEIVMVSFQPVPDLDKHRELLKELKMAQAQYSETAKS